MSALFKNQFFIKNNINPEFPDFWNQKYINNDTQWDLGFPTPIFVNWSKSIKHSRKKILIPGSGKGHDAIFLASQSHDVYAVDFSLKATEYLKNKAKKNNIKLNALCEDFFNLNKYYGKMDIILEYTFFCAINPEYRLKYIKETFNLLNDDGLFVGIILPINKDINEGGPPYGINLDEIIKEFSIYYDILECKKSNLSIKPRMENEVFTIMKKKCKR